MEISLSPDESKIVLRFPYNSLTVAQVRAIGGTRFLPVAKIWTAPKDIPTYEALVSSFPMADWNKKIHAWAKEFYSRIEENKEAKNGAAVEESYLFKDSAPKPFAHQVKALDLIHKNKAYALCCEMGTGKTRAIVDLISDLKRKGEFTRALIVCPLSVVGNWPKEFEKWGEGFKCQMLVGDKVERIKRLNEPADVYVINYAGMRIMQPFLEKLDWDVMACDESQNIKNRTAQQSKACYSIGKKSKRRYILTGTLVTNKPLDVFGQFKFLDENILGSNYFAFQGRYAIMSRGSKVQFPVGFKNIEELSSKLYPWSYRVLKSDCLDLPEKIYETRYAEMAPEAWSVYKQLGKELVAELEGGDHVVAPLILTKLLRFSQITAGFVTLSSGEIKELGNGKGNVLLEILEESIGKCVVWVKFRKELELVRRALSARSIGHVTLSGDDAQEKRQEAIEKFNGDDGVRVFIGQIEAGGTGINLTAASTCVYMSNSYSLGTRLQSEDRLHRIGQKNNVTYFDVVVPGTIDEKVLELLRQKKEIADVINQDKEMAKNLIGDGVL